MIMVPRDEKTKTILIPCNCGIETMEITRADWENVTDYYISFKIDSFQSGQ